MPTSTPLRVVSWNVRASMTSRVLDELCSDPTVDLFVLSEYRIPRRGDLIRARLADAGWKHALHSHTAAGQKGVAVFAKHPLKPAPELLDRWRPRGHDLSRWIVAASLPSAGVSVVGTYVPFPDGALKEAVWQALIGAAKRHRMARLLIAGDFNSCFPHEADSGRGYTIEPLTRMAAAAIDLWRAAVPSPGERDQITWAGPNGMGNRIDFVFGTPGIASMVTAAAHRHEIRERGISDHAPVVIDLLLPAARADRRPDRLASSSATRA